MPILLCVYNKLEDAVYLNISSLCFCDCIYIMSRNLCYKTYLSCIFLLTLFNIVRYGVKSRTFVCSTCEGELVRVLLSFICYIIFSNPCVKCSCEA
jgi:hypothetical protein